MNRFAEPTIAEDRRAERLDTCERADASAAICRARVACLAAMMRAMRDFAGVAARHSAAVAGGHVVSAQQFLEIEAQLADVIDDAVLHIVADINWEAA